MQSNGRLLLPSKSQRPAMAAAVTGAAAAVAATAGPAAAGPAAASRLVLLVDVGHLSASAAVVRLCSIIMSHYNIIMM